MKHFRFALLIALAGCTSVAEPLPAPTSLSFHLDGGCPSPLALDFFIDDALREVRLVTAGDSVAYVVAPGAHAVAVQIHDTPLGWTPRVDVGLGQRLQLLLHC